MSRGEARHERLIASAAGKVGKPTDYDSFATAMDARMLRALEAFLEAWEVSRRWQPLRVALELARFGGPSVVAHLLTRGKDGGAA